MSPFWDYELIRLDRLWLPTAKLVWKILETEHRLASLQSRTQSLQAFWSAGQRREDSGDIEKIQFFWLAVP